MYVHDARDRDECYLWKVLAQLVVIKSAPLAAVDIDRTCTSGSTS
jgi:hypothetical protein